MNLPTHVSIHATARLFSMPTVVLWLTLPLRTSHASSLDLCCFTSAIVIGLLLGLPLSPVAQVHQPCIMARLRAETPPACRGKSSTLDSSAAFAAECTVCL